MSKMGLVLLLVLISALIMGCGPEKEPELVIFSIEIINGTPVEGINNFVATKEDTVSIFVSSDEDITFHLHGYDLVKNVKTDVPEVFIFTANATGRFEVVTHGVQGHHTGHKHSDHSDHSQKEDEEVVAILEIRPR